MALLNIISQHLCREYKVPCPACGTENAFARLKPDIYRATRSEPDGHPFEMDWRVEVELPIWVTPLNYFWAVCGHCAFAGQIDDAEFRTWKKTAAKYRNQFREGALDALGNQAGQKQGMVHKLAGVAPDDIFGAQLAQFFLGIFTECQKNDPVAGTLARSYLRIAWIYRDETRLYGEFAPTSTIRAFLSELEPAWNKAIPENADWPAPPQLVSDEVSALRQTLAFFEWNFRELQSAGHEEEMRLMALIAEIGYRIYEITGASEDFTKAQSLFSGVMQKCLSVINDKNIVGGAVNRARDTLEKAGERGRELRTLQQKWAKTPPVERPAAPAATTAPAPPPKTSKQPAPQAAKPAKQPPPAPEEKPAKPSVFDAPSATGSQRELHQKIEQLDAENKRWMRLAGISDITGLPNRVMLSRILLPGALKQASARKEALGCIVLSPQGLQEINSKYGRAAGDAIIRKFSDCLRALVRTGERLCHLDGVNFALLVPRMTTHQLEKRAEAIHKDLTSRRFELGASALSVKVSVGVANLLQPNGQSPKALQDDLYNRSIQALDRAKMQGNHIEAAP